MAVEGDIIINRYIYRGEEGEVIPDGATHISVVAKIIRANAFWGHPNIVEVICHDKVEKIEYGAFYRCPSLRRVIMPGVRIVEIEAFFLCNALTDMECGKLEIIGAGAFRECKSLRSINLPSVRIVEQDAFDECEALMDAIFGSKLERIEESAFYYCISLERITIPLKDGMIPHDCTFQECEKIKHVDLVEEELLSKIVAALHSEEWRNDMYEEIDAINQTLPSAEASYIDDSDDVEGEKAIAIRSWIGSLLGRIIDYKAEHRRLLDEDVAPTLQLFVPQDIVMNNVLPFLNLPSHSFER